MESRIFYTELRLQIEQAAKDFLNAQEDYLSTSTVGSTRAAGDAIQNLSELNFQSFLGNNCVEYSANFPRRAMADFAFRDSQNFYYVVDVKTHRTDTKFNMPNLISVERLSKLYQDEKNYFALLLVSYSVKKIKVTVNEVKFIPIEFLDWSCLTIGALGWGQIQIKNSNTITINPKMIRRKWMLELCEKMIVFYEKEVKKILNRRVKHFEEVKEYWLAKSE